MSDFPTDAERNDIDQAFGYVPEPEPLEHMLALVGRIVAAREAEAWDEGYDAGHRAARSVNPEWPDDPRNPYRKEPS